MKALTIKQPWASLIMAGIRDVENRTWPTSYRGPLYIHAGLGVDEWGLDKHGYLIDDVPAGVILGRVTVADCVWDYRSRWAVPDNYQWVLTDPRLLKRPIRVTGKLGFWDYERPRRIARWAPGSGGDIPLQLGAVVSTSCSAVSMSDFAEGGGGRVNETDNERRRRHVLAELLDEIASERRTTDSQSCTTSGFNVVAGSDGEND